MTKYICIQQLKMALIIVSGSFDVMTVVAECCDQGDEVISYYDKI